MISVGSAPPANEAAVLSMRCIAAPTCSTYDWHRHPFFEFSFVSDDEATIGYPPGMQAVATVSLAVVLGRSVGRARHLAATSVDSRDMLPAHRMRACPQICQR